MRAVAVLAAILALAGAVQALAGTTTAVESGAGLAASRVAVDPAGVAAALYPGQGGVRLQLAGPGAPPERVPVPAGGVVEGFAMASGGRPAVLVRTRRDCAPLLILVRSAPDAWTSEAVGGAPARAATLAADPAGNLSALTAACDGSLSLRARGPADWVEERVGQVASKEARLSLQVGPGGAAVGGWSGRAAGIAVRDPSGAWRPVGLPGGPLAQGDTATSLAVALDPQSRPVALVVRGPARAKNTGDGDLGQPDRRAARLVDGAWTPFGAAAVSPSLLSGSGLSFTLVTREGLALSESPAGASRADLDPVALGVGAGGDLAYVLRAGPSVLGTGSPARLAVSARPTVAWGARLTLAARLTDAGAPVAGAGVRSEDSMGVTDADGRAQLQATVTRTGRILLDAATPGPVAPAFASLTVRVVPRAARLSGRVIRRGKDRVSVRGRVSGGAPLAGPLGRVWLIDVATGASGFLPGRALASTGRRGGFTLTGARRRGTELALFFEGRMVRLLPSGAPRQR